MGCYRSSANVEQTLVCSHSEQTKVCSTFALFQGVARDMNDSSLFAFDSLNDLAAGSVVELEEWIKRLRKIPDARRAVIQFLVTARPRISIRKQNLT